MMKYNKVGTSNIYLSAVGFGTCQLRRIPEKNAIETLKRGFHLGVNWVHTSPDYGGTEYLIARAIAESGKKIYVLSQGYGDIGHFEFLFDNTCRLLRTRSLEMFGIACIDDREYLGENVWGEGGMIEFLLEKKRKREIKGIFCSTHGSTEYVSRLIRSKLFDAIMLSYNPLGFHLLSYFPKDKQFENIEMNRKKLFGLAYDHNVGLLIMKPLAGGMLCRSKAFPAFKRFSTEEALSSTTILRYILRHPAICAVVPGTASIEEAEENARAGYLPIDLSTQQIKETEKTVSVMKKTLCSRCGKCESLCSRSLPISWLFRAGYISNYPSETFETLDRLQYFHLHPSEKLECLNCSDKTCRCPNDIDIPLNLERIHKHMIILRDQGLLPEASGHKRKSIIFGHHTAQIVSKEICLSLKPGQRSVYRIWLENSGNSKWTSSISQDKKGLVTLGVNIGRRFKKNVMLRHDVEPGERTYFAFEIEAPAKTGIYSVKFFLKSRFNFKNPNNISLIYKANLLVEDTITQPQKIKLANSKTYKFVTKAFFEIAKALYTKYQKCDFKRFSTTGDFIYGALFLDHNIPACNVAGSVIGARVTVENKSNFSWSSSDPEGKHINLIVMIDNQNPETFHLSRTTVSPDERTTICFPLRIPFEKGPHTIRIDLVRQNDAIFSDHGVKPLELVITSENSPNTAVLQLIETANNINPWHYRPTSGINIGTTGNCFPLFTSSAKGCKLWDSEGREYIDYVMGWGSCLLGYADYRIQKALTDILHTAPIAPFPHPVEMEVSLMLSEDFPCADMAIFGKNGSDVCTVAARLARVVTGKKVILFSGYHGWQDFWAEQKGFPQTGIPERPEGLIHFFKFNNEDDFFRLYNLYKSDLAAVMLEPSGPGESIQGPEQDASPKFLSTIAEAARNAAALLIFDEIFTGYRYPKGSVQKAIGVIPDLTCLGKAIASGMPLSALVGRSEIFQRGMANVCYGPTYKGEIYSFAAAKAAINIYRDEPVAEYVWNFGTRLKNEINRICNHAGLKAECKGPPFRSALIFNEPDYCRLRMKRTLYQQELLKAGVITYNGIMIPSYAHNEAALEQTIASVERAVDRITRADLNNDFERYIEIPLI